MTFCYRYQDKERGVLTSEIAASSQSDAYSLLRKNGIRPMSVWPKPGVVNRISSIGKRGYAIVVLSVITLISVYIALRAPDHELISQESGGSRTLQTLPRQQIPSVNVRLPYVSDNALEAFARPGDVSGLAAMSNTAAELFVDLEEAVRRPIPIASSDADDIARLKRIINGMKQEIEMSLRCGDSKDVILARLIARQRMEAAYRAKAIEDVRRNSTTLESCNETLRVMSLKEASIDEI